MNSKEVATYLETDAKRLRRFLRQDPTYRNAGQGGRYEFEEKDLTTLKKRFNSWVAKTTAKADPKPKKKVKRSKRDDAMPESFANIPVGNLTKAQREERDRRSRARVDRLEAQLKAKGLHISQIRSRENA